MLIQDNVLRQVEKYRKQNHRRGIWRKIVSTMACMVVFVTTYLLILPAITMTNSTMEVEASQLEALVGDVIWAEVYAEAANSRKETVFVLAADGENAGLDESEIDFDDDGTAVLLVENVIGDRANEEDYEEERELELHREYEEDGTVYYWFALEKGEAVHFYLPWINGTDRYTTEKVLEDVIVPEKPEKPELPKETELPEESSEADLTEEESTAIEEEESSGEEASSDETEEPKSAEEETSGNKEDREKETSGHEDEEDEAGGHGAGEGETDESDEEGGSSDKTDETEKENESEKEDEADKSNDAGEDAGETEENNNQEEDTDTSDDDEVPEYGGDSGNTDEPEVSGEQEAAGEPEEQDSAGENISAASLSMSQHRGQRVFLSYRTATGSNAYVDDDDDVEKIYRVEIVLDQEGDPEQEGGLTLVFGSGASLRDAKNKAEETIELSWLTELEEEEPMEMPEDADSWMTVEKKGFSANSNFRVRSRVMSMVSFLNDSYEQESKEPIELAPYIQSVTVSILENGIWVPKQEFTDGDNVRVEMYYKIPEDTIGTGGSILFYELPDGVQFDKMTSGIVYDGQTPVGTYIMDENGRITIEFYEVFSDNKPFTGKISFKGTVSVDDQDTEKKIEFGESGSTITIRPNQSETDIHIEKEGFYNDEDKKLHYTVTVSTENGTADEVTITDYIGGYNGETNMTYDENSFKIVKVGVNEDGEPAEKEMEGYSLVIGTNAYNGNRQTFTVSGLPQLEANEKYVLTYTTTPDKSSNLNGISKVSNSAAGSSGEDSSSDWDSIEIYREMVQKWGWYDAGSGMIHWTIILNTDKRDISKYVLGDVMEVNGKTIEIPEGTTITMRGEKTSETTITLPYTFPDDSNDTYTITYQTKAPEGEAGQSWIVSNKVELDGDDGHYETSTYPVTGTTRDYGIRKTFQTIVNPTTETMGIYQWFSIITVPQITVPETEEGKKSFLDNLVYTDELKDVTAEGKQIEGSHYITAALLANMTVTVNATSLIRDIDYQICDQEGKVIDFSDESHMTGFRVEFLPPAVEKVNGQTIELRYQSSVDYEKLEESISYTIKNIGSIPEHESEAATAYKRFKKLEKQVINTEKEDWEQDKYTSSGLTLDYNTSGGVIHYRLLLTTDEKTEGPITVVDDLPEGTHLIENSVTMKFYGNEYYQPEKISWYSSEVNGHKTYVAAENIRAVEGSDGKVTFIINEGFNGDGESHTLAVYYDISFKEDLRWGESSLESRSYLNKAQWDDKKAETEVTVKREVPDLEKIGKQITQYDEQGNEVLMNVIRYTILVNVRAEDLVDDPNDLILIDKLDIKNEEVKAEFQLGSVKLYNYDPWKEGYCGTEIDRNQYSYVYDPANYEVTFNLPDETACVLVYEYEIDYSKVDKEFTIHNVAQLNGKQVITDEERVIINKSSTDMQVTKRWVTIYKLDSANHGKPLRGAKFKLEAYNFDASRWDMVETDIETDDKGEFSLNYTDENGIFKSNVLYRLTETEAPAGYVRSEDAYYFVWINNDTEQEQMETDIRSKKVLTEEEMESIKFFTSYLSIYVVNEHRGLTVQKVWKDTNGVEFEPDTDSIKVQLWQQPLSSDACAVTLTSQGKNGEEPITTTFQVKRGTSFDIEFNGAYEEMTVIVNGRSETKGGEERFNTGEITGPTSIIVHSSGSHVYPWKDIRYENYTKPDSCLGERVPWDDPVVLTKENGWSYTWEGEKSLPLENEKGQSVYYTVEEVSSVPGYTVIYSLNNNAGIQTGELVITNQKIYTLPESGGIGIGLFAMGGAALTALAGLMYIILRRKEDCASS